MCPRFALAAFFALLPAIISLPVSAQASGPSERSAYASYGLQLQGSQWECSWAGFDVTCEKDGRAWRWRDDDRNNDPRVRGRIFIFDPAGTGTEVFDQCSIAWTSPSRTGTTHTREFSLDPNGPLSASGDPSSWADTACPSGTECQNGACVSVQEGAPSCSGQGQTCGAKNCCPGLACSSGVCSPSGCSSSPAKLDSVYPSPNPADNSVLITASGQCITRIRASVFDLSGRNIFTSKWAAGTSVLIETKSWPSGSYTYSVEVSSGQAQAAKRTGSFSVLHKALASLCTKVVDSGSSSDKLDIVFVGDKYSSASAFVTDVYNAVYTIFSIEPFKSKRNKINVYYVSRMDDLQCRFGSGSSERLITCNEFSVKRAAKECPFEKVIVLVDSPQNGGAANAINGDIAASKGTSSLVVVHELGHLLGLEDEYTYDTATNRPIYGPNCDDRFSGSQQKQCPKWPAVQGAGCYQGCRSQKWYRPTLNSCLMYNLAAQNFDPVDAAYLGSYLDSRYRLGDAAGQEAETYSDISIARIKHKDGRFSLLDIVSDKGYLPEAGDGNAVLDVLSTDGTRLYSSSVNIPLYMISENFAENGEIAGEISEIREAEFALIMPAMASAEKAELHMGDKKVLSFSLTGSKSPISLRKGWNMISSPVTVPVADIASACPVKGGRAFWYGSNGYESPDSISPLKGHWLYSDSDCSANVFGEAELTFVSLHPGWNMISGSRSWNEMKGDCERISSVWSWDTDGQKYEKIASYEELDPTKGYWVKVRKACTIVS